MHGPYDIISFRGLLTLPCTQWGLGMEADEEERHAVSVWVCARGYWAFVNAWKTGCSVAQEALRLKDRRSLITKASSDVGGLG